MTLFKKVTKIFSLMLFINSIKGLNNLGYLSISDAYRRGIGYMVGTMSLILINFIIHS